jgi:lipopolysaccharide transport system permease protein
MAILHFIRRYLWATWLGFKGPAEVVWHNHNLLLLLVKRDIVTRTSGTFLGNIWLLLQPALQVVGFWFLLDVVLRIKFPGNVPFVDYFLVGILAWLFISASVGWADARKPINRVTRQMGFAALSPSYAGLIISPIIH